MANFRSYSKQKKTVVSIEPKLQSELNKMLIKGFSLHQKGFHNEAQKIYKEALNLQPKNFDALQIAGSLALQMNQYEEAVVLLSHAIEVNPNQAAVYFNLGLALEKLREYNAAIKNYDAAVRINPNYFSANFNCAILLADLKQFERALNKYDEVIKLNPDFAEAYFNKGIALHELSQFEAAIANYDIAIKLDNTYLDAFFNRGVSLDKLNNFQAAISNYDEVIKLNPDFAKAYYNKGIALHELSQFEAAIANYDIAIKLDNTYLDAFFNRGVSLDKLNNFQAAISNYDEVIKLNPDSVAAYSNKGLSLSELNRFEDAVVCHKKAIELRPDYAEAFINIGAALSAMKEFKAAIESYDEAISIDSKFASAYWNKAMIKLILGEYQEGWALYEWRWKIIDVPKGHYLRYFEKPLWLGETSLKNKIILIHAEQGLGDSIQFCRLISKIQELKPKQILLEVPKVLISLLSTLQNRVTLIEQGESLPEFDLQCPMMSLPYACNITLATIPTQIPYLYSEKNKSKLWQDKLGIKTKLRVGIAWSGSLNHPSDRNPLTRRNIPLDRLMDLFGLPCEFHLLQKEIKRDDQLVVNSLTQINCHQDELKDFSDTAALVMQMDLVISICTSVAHLSGSLGIRTWVLLPYSADYRWMLDRNDSPWYPSATLYRQPEIGDWDSVIDQVKVALLALINTEDLRSY